ncbi:Pol polyprotein [Elysia marginata]|uniref:Pol polyprotein n=1 Tax=Elysia marginata TaxID=1093978 RepID=A0AAV4HUI1_9GAST|nr:Pol polyprotein [Elysia marginata]
MVDLYIQDDSEDDEYPAMIGTLKDAKSSNDWNINVLLDGLEQPLLGRPAIEALNLLQRINSVKGTQESVDFKKEFPELFTGLSNLQKEYKIQLKDDVVPPKISSPRRIPLPLRKDVEIELQKLQEQDIIKKVTEPTDWCSGLVVVPKASRKIRLCVDLTKLNEGVKRENFPLPLTEELLTRLAEESYSQSLTVIQVSIRCH